MHRWQCGPVGLDCPNLETPKPCCGPGDVWEDLLDFLDLSNLLQLRGPWKGWTSKLSERGGLVFLPLLLATYWMPCLPSPGGHSHS